MLLYSTKVSKHEHNTRVKMVYLKTKVISVFQLLFKMTNIPKYFPRVIHLYSKTM